MAPGDILDPVMENLANEISKHTARIPLVPSQWKKYPAHLNYTWHAVPYHKSGIPLVPDNAVGVYAFVVNPGIAGHDLGYLLYVGKAEKQSLRARFKQYFKEHKDPKGRPYVRQMLDYWSGYLEFRYTTLNASMVSSVEDALLDAFIPHCNERFSATIRPAVKAFRKR
jgi:hypothetical protein